MAVAMKVLVTGATGFVGAAVARTLLAARHDVRVLVRPASNRSNIEGLDVEVSEGDLTETRDACSWRVRGCEGLLPCRRRLSVVDPRSRRDDA